MDYFVENHFVKSYNVDQKNKFVERLQWRLAMDYIQGL